MANYIAIGVGELTGHAALVSVDSVSAEELFWAIDEHMNPYSCVFAKVNSISLYFPVKTVLETETEPENESFHDLNNITPTEERNVEAGDAVGLRLNEWAQELWKHLTMGAVDEKSMSDEWKVFNRRDDHIVNYYRHKSMLGIIRDSAKLIAENSYKLPAND